MSRTITCAPGSLEVISRRDLPYLGACFRFGALASKTNVVTRDGNSVYTVRVISLQKKSAASHSCLVLEIEPESVVVNPRVFSAQRCCGRERIRFHPGIRRFLRFAGASTGLRLIVPLPLSAIPCTVHGRSFHSLLTSLALLCYSVFAVMSLACAFCILLCTEGVLKGCFRHACTDNGQGGLE